MAEALRRDISVDEIYGLTKIDPWFLDNIRDIIKLEKKIKAASLSNGTPRGRQWHTPRRVPVSHCGVNRTFMQNIKEYGFSDRYVASLMGVSEQRFREHRQKLNVSAVYKTVDTCGAEFEAKTPYLYSTFEKDCESNPTDKKKIVILGGDPNRIGQGIEFDYCCVHAAFALREIGIESIMINCNTETVSTDYDTSDRLYFEPLTFEGVMNVIEKEKPDGVIVQFGGQTPLKLAVPLEKAGVKIIGTSPDSIDTAEDRKRGNRLPKNKSLFSSISS